MPFCMPFCMNKVCRQFVFCTLPLSLRGKGVERTKRQTNSRPRLVGWLVRWLVGKESVEMTKQFSITLQAQPDPSDPSGYRRLRKALKVFLRSFGLRFTDVSERADTLETDDQPGRISER